MSKTKIVVFKLKELIYTVLFVCLGILLLILLALLLMSGKKDGGSPTGNPDAAETSAIYHAGVYTSVLSLNGTALHLEIVCDDSHINSVRLVNLDESITTMYPLLGPALEDLELQLAKDIPVAELTLTESSKYTQTMLIEVIEQTLAKAVCSND